MGPFKPDHIARVISGWAANTALLCSLTQSHFTLRSLCGLVSILRVLFRVRVQGSLQVNPSQGASKVQSLSLSISSLTSST